MAQRRRGPTLTLRRAPELARSHNVYSGMEAESPSAPLGNFESSDPYLGPLPGNRSWSAGSSHLTRRWASTVEPEPMVSGDLALRGMTEAGRGMICGLIQLSAFSLS